MCGIAGAYLWQGTPNREALGLAARRLHHRGPDEGGVFYKDNMGLVHTRLSIIDLAGGTQPLHSGDGELHLVANGEIYNYLELARDPELARFKPGSGSDCETILQAWQAHGKEGIKKLNGMFAFALYDSNRQVLSLGRDRLGIKPLFYSRTPEGLFFASEIKALLALLPSQPQISASAASQFFNYQFNTGRQTIYQGIERLLPGEILQVSSDGQLQHWKYWQLTDVEPQDLSISQALEEFDALNDQVMKEHMRSDVPFGLFLSGGIDSSVILAELQRLQSEQVRTFTIGYENTSMADEIGAADQLAQRFGTLHRSIRVSKEDLFGAIVRSCWAADDLMRDYASLPTMLLSRAAAEDVKVVFSGEGGDEAFAGYRRYHRNVETYFKQMLFGAGGNRVKGQWSSGRHQSAMRLNLSGEDARAPFRDLWQTYPSQWSWMQKSQAIDIQSALADNLLVKADRMMMSAGIEGRVPFSDHRLVEFGLSLPDRVKYCDGKGKQLIRQWAQKQLPADLLAKPKRGFYVPVAEWLRGDFVDQLKTALVDHPLLENWFVPEGVAALFAEHQQRGNRSREIWSLMQFVLWQRLMTDLSDSVPDYSEDPLQWIR